MCVWRLNSWSLQPAWGGWGGVRSRSPQKSQGQELCVLFKLQLRIPGKISISLSLSRSHTHIHTRTHPKQRPLKVSSGTPLPLAQACPSTEERDGRGYGPAPRSQSPGGCSVGLSGRPSYLELKQKPGRTFHPHPPPPRMSLQAWSEVTSGPAHCGAGGRLKVATGPSAVFSKGFLGGPSNQTGSGENGGRAWRRLRAPGK